MKSAVLTGSRDGLKKSARPRTLSEFAITALDLSRIAITLEWRRRRKSIGSTVRVIAKSKLREFWEARKTDAAIAKRDLLAWHKIAENATWANFGALKQTFGTAD